MLGVKRLGLIAGLAVLGLAPASAVAAAAPEVHTAVAPSSQDQQFLQGLHQVNLSEIATGNLARQKGVNQQVKDLGARFVTDHTQLDQTVQNTARSVSVSLPNAPTADQQSVLNQLQRVSGNTFDTQWVTIQLIGHAQATQMVQTELSQGTDSSVRLVAQEALPVLQAHHEALVALAQSLGIAVPSASPGTPSPSGTTGTPSPGGTTGSPSPSGTTGTPSPGGTTGSPSPSGTTGTPSPGGTTGAPSPSETTGTPSPSVS
jgi:predicted outer membrane protein